MNAKVELLYQVFQLEIGNVGKSDIAENHPLDPTSFQNQRYGVLQSGVVVPLTQNIQKELGLLEDIVEKTTINDVFIDAGTVRNNYVLHTYLNQSPDYSNMSRNFLPSLFSNRKEIKNEWLSNTEGPQDPNEILLGTLFNPRTNSAQEVGMYLTPQRQLALTTDYEEVLEKRYKLA